VVVMVVAAFPGFARDARLLMENRLRFRFEEERPGGAVPANPVLRKDLSGFLRTASPPDRHLRRAFLRTRSRFGGGSG